MNYKNPDFFRRSENFFPKKDNSALLRRAFSKRYKEDNFKNLINNEEINNSKEKNEDNNNILKYNNYTSKHLKKNEIDENVNIKQNYNKNFFQTYNTHKSNFNTHGTFYHKVKNENKPNISQALLERMQNKNKYNIDMNNYYTSNISDDNVYQEFIINYDSGVNEDVNKQSNTLERAKNNINILNRKNKIYNRVTLNNGRYKIDKKSTNNNFYSENRMEYFSSTYEPNHPYQRRKIVDFYEKEQIENGMPDRIKKELYFKNNRNNLTNYNFFTGNTKRNSYNYNFNTYNQNYDRNNKIPKRNLEENNMYENRFNYNFNISQNDFRYNQNNLIYNKFNNNKNIAQKINKFLEHFSEYCILYYHRIIKQLFSYLKKARENAITQKYMIISNKNNAKDKKSISDNYNISTKNQLLKKGNNNSNYRNYLTKAISTVNTKNQNDNNNERIPYHKRTQLMIERIRSNNESKSPDKTNNFEMFRDIKELSKKYEIINNRKSRQSYSNFNKADDLSFNSYSVEKNKEKEKWEKNLEKERKLKKIKEQKNELNKRQKQKEKNNLIYIQNNESLENNDNKNMNLRNNKYKRINLNNKNKFQMRIVKKIQTKDKKIQINIKYLNYYKPIKIKEKRFSDNKYKSLQKSNIFEITLFAIKNRYKNLKKENNNTKDKKLASIKEEKENKIEASLSDEVSQ